MKGWKKVFLANSYQKRAEVITLIDEIDFQTKTVITDKEVHNIMVKEIHQQDITVITIHVPSIRATGGQWLTCGEHFESACRTNTSSV